MTAPRCKSKKKTRQRLEALLASLETVELLRRAPEGEGIYQFKHTLTPETVVNSLLRTKRREINVLLGRPDVRKVMKPPCRLRRVARPSQDRRA